MPWQDFALSIGTIILIIALLPSVFSSSKPALPTSILTGAIMSIFAFVYGSLSLWFTTGSVTLIALLWFVLALQKYRLDKSGDGK